MTDMRNIQNVRQFSWRLAQVGNEGPYIPTEINPMHISEYVAHLDPNKVYS